MRPVKQAGPAAARAGASFDFLSAYHFERARSGPSAAMRQLSQMLRGAPPGLWAGCAHGLLESSAAEAQALLESARSLHAADPELLQLHSAACRAAGDEAALEAVLRQALAFHPDDDETAAELSLLLRTAGRMTAAAAVQRRRHRRNPDLRQTLETAEFLEGCQRTGDAYALCRQALDRGLASTRLHYDAGTLALALGRFDEAAELLRAALDGDMPEWGALLPLALSHPHRSVDDADLARYHRAWTHRSQLSAHLRPVAGFALAKALDDLGDYAGAARTARAANALVRDELRWSAGDWRVSLTRQLSTRLPALPPTEQTPGLVPVFIVGLPRTGTTLVAELLGRHPQVRNRGELHWISYLDQRLRRSARLHDTAALAAAAQLYRKHLRQDDAPARCYIDKNPLNFRHLGLIAALLPEARIVHCRRSPRDTALSNWLQLFDHPDNAWAYDFDDIAAFAAGHDRLMSHWPQRLRLPVLTVDYEALVAAPQQTMSSVFDFIDLPPCEVLAQTSRSDTAIGSASVWQARQPVNAGSIGRWRRYAEHLPELVDKFPD